MVWLSILNSLIYPRRKICLHFQIKELDRQQLKVLVNQKDRYATNLTVNTGFVFRVLIFLGCQKECFALMFKESLHFLL